MNDPSKQVIGVICFNKHKMNRTPRITTRGFDPRLNGDFQFDSREGTERDQCGADRVGSLVGSTKGERRAYTDLIRLCEPMKQGFQFLFTFSLPLQVTA